MNDSDNKYWTAPKCAVKELMISNKRAIANSNSKAEQQRWVVFGGARAWSRAPENCFLGTNPCAPETSTCAQCTKKSNNRIRTVQDFFKNFRKVINFEIEDRQPKDVKKVWRHKRLVSKMSSSSTRIVQEQQQYMDSTRIFKNFRKL